MTARRNPGIPAVGSQLLPNPDTKSGTPGLMGKFREIVAASRGDR